MNRIAFALAALLVLGAGAFSPSAWGDEKTDKERSALQGTWELLRYEEGGKLVVDDVKRTWVIDGDKISLQSDGKEILQRTLTLDPAKNPRYLDMHAGKEHTDSAIYVRAGDYMIMCGNRPSQDGKKRPTEFTSGTEAGGAFLFVWRIRR